MNIKTIVKDIVAGLSAPGTFRYGWKGFLNFKGDGEAVFPLRYLDYPIKSNDALRQSGLIESGFPITIAFLDKTKLDFTPDQHDVIIQEQRTQSTEFITACQNSELIHFVRDSKRTEIVNIFDINLSGIILEITLLPFDPDATC